MWAAHPETDVPFEGVSRNVGHLLGEVWKELQLNILAFPAFLHGIVCDTERVLRDVERTGKPHVCCTTRCSCPLLRSVFRASGEIACWNK